MKTKIESANAPQAVGPYSQAILVNDTLYVSGTMPINPKDGTIKDDIEGQAKQVFENINAVLNEAGFTFDNVVKTTAFLTDLNNFATFNSIYQSYFNAPYPARSCIEISRLPKDVLVEVECICVK